MALDKSTLEAAILETFERAKEEEWETEQVAASLADAIDAFVRGGEVVGITTRVTVDPGTHRGTGRQTGTGSIQ